MAQFEANAQGHSLQQFSDMPEIRGAEMRGEKFNRRHPLCRVSADGSRDAACHGWRGKALNASCLDPAARKILKSNGILSSARLARLSIFIRMPH